MMGDEERRLIESVLERGFDRMESRFDGLAAEIRSHGTEIALIKQVRAPHRGEDDKRDKRISTLARAVGDVDKEVSQVNAKPGPTAVDVVKLLDEREEQRSKRQRQWLAWGLPLLIALLGAPQVRSCVGEERAARVEQAVQRLEQKAEAPPRVVKVPVPQPVPVPVPTNGGE